MSQYLQPETRKNQSPSKIPTEHTLLQYRNGFFQGYIDEYSQRQDRGAYLWNTGEIYYGEWNQDRMEGEGIFYFALGGYVYGTFLDDRVHGYAVLCFSNGDYTAGFWERGVLNGKVVQHSLVENDWSLEEYKDGIPVRVLMKGKGHPPLDTFTMLETYSIKKLLEKDSGLFASEKANNERGDRSRLDFLPIDPDGWYHGNIQSRGPHGLGIVSYSEHKSDRGLFKNGALSGLGRSLFSNGDVYDGFYQEGKFHGIGVYFKSETEQYLYGMYESNECVQALTLGNGFPHELMRTLKADFHLESAEFIDKETETEVLTLSYNDQNPSQEQEEYEDISKPQVQDRSFNSRKRREEEDKNRNMTRENGSVSQVHDSQFSEQSQRSQKIKRETDTRSSISSKKSKNMSKKGTNQELEVGSNISIKDKAGSRKTIQEEEMTNSRTSKNLEKERLRQSVSSQASDNLSERFVSRKSIQAEVNERKPASKSAVEYVHKSIEKNAYEQYSVKNTDPEKMYTDGKSNSSYSGSPQRDNDTSIYKTENSEARDVFESSMPYHVRTSDLVEKASIKAQTYEPRVINRFPTDFSASDKSTSFNVEKSVSQPQSHELKASYQFLTDYGADRSMDLKTDLSNTTIEVPKSSYSLYPSQTNITSEITYGIDSQVRKIMDRIFLQNAQNAAASNLNLPLNSTMDSGITGNGSYMFSALDKPTEYGKPLDRSPTFAHFNNEYHPTFDYTRSDNSLGSYTGNASLGLENKERVGNDNVNPDWNIKVYPSLESSLVNLKPNKECSKTSQITQVTGSFGLIPNAPSEESLTSKMVGDQSKMSQASNTFLEIDLTRDRGVSGKFGGSYEPTNPAIVPEAVKPEYYAAETTYKNYNFAGDNQISTSHGDIDSKSYLKAKTPINKKIEHSRENPYENLSCSPASNTVLESPHLEYGRTYEVHVDRSYDEHVKSTVPANLSNFESPSGRASIVTKTDTWSAYTAPKNLEGGSMTYSEKPFDFTANEVLKRFGIDKSLMELGSKEVSLRDVPSEILDGSVSNRYNYMNNGYLEKKVTEIPSYLMPTDNRPIMISTPEKESSNSRLEEELYKIILLKLELLVKEQNKAVETAEDIKRSLNEKLDALFREERRENDTFKILLNQKLDSLFKERTYDMSREQLNQIHQDLTGSNKQISASFCGVNKKLDLLLLKQGRLTVETEDNLVNKLDTMISKQSRQSSINANSIAVSHVVKQISHKDSVGSKAEELVKSQESGENVRSEILIADSSVDYSTQKKHRKESASLRQPTASPNVMIKDFSKDTELSKNTKSDYNTNSRQSSIKEQRSTQEQKIYRSSEKEQVEAKRRAQVEQSRKIENDMSNISDDATEYASIASDSAPLKVVKSMQPKSKEFSIKNEHTLNLLQYESELRHLNSQDKYVTPKKPDINTLNTPKEKNLVPRSLTPTPQSRGHTEISHRNYDQARSPRPITSQNASMVMDSQPGTYRQSKIEFTSGKSPVANQRDSITQVSFNGRSTEKQDKKKSIYTFPVAQSKDNTQARDSAQWHVIPLCAQESLFDEPEEIIEEYNGDYQAYEESKTQAQKASVKKNSLVSNHNRANSISSQSSYNVFDLKSFQRPSTTKKGDCQDRSLQNPSAQAVFDNFVVTSNNNDISVGGEYVRVEKNSAAHRNMAFMRKDFESPSGPKIVSSAKKQAVQSSTVDLYEEEREQGKNKKKTGSKDIFPWKNEEGGERFSTGNNEATYVQTSPMRREKGQKTVYQEGRMGTMRWRLEIEDMANETEGSQGYYENEEYERNLMYEKKMKAMSAMNSPIGQRREFEHLMRTVNPAKDIGTYENNMFSTGKSKNDDMMSSGEKGYRQTEVKVPSLQLGGNIPTNRSKKQNPYGYHNLSISHIEKDMKYQ